MSRVHHIELRYEIDPEHESIHGEMSDRQGKSLPFSGWTEFATCLVSLTSSEAGESDRLITAMAGDDSETNSNDNEEQ